MKKLINLLEKVANIPEDSFDLSVKGNNVVSIWFRMFIGSLFVFLFSTMILLIFSIPQLIVYFYKIKQRKRYLQTIKQSLKKHEYNLLNNNKIADTSLKINYPSYITSTSSLEDFIRSFINYYNIFYSTLYKSGEVQCTKNRRRSLGDIFLVCRTYYPDCTLKEVLLSLIKLINEGSIYSCYCNTINKYVFYSNKQSMTNVFDHNLEWVDDKEITFEDILNNYKKL